MDRGGEVDGKCNDGSVEVDGDGDFVEGEDDTVDAEDDTEDDTDDTDDTDGVGAITPCDTSFSLPNSSLIKSRRLHGS